MIKGNYHTHIYRCNHANGDVADYARTAIDAGLSILAITDHTPLPNNKWIEMRMHMNELSDYIESIDEAKKMFPQLTILKGMECEYLKEYHNFYEDELLGKYKFDFLSASAHYYPNNGIWRYGWGDIRDKQELCAYTEYIVEMINTGLFDYVAHPDMFGGSYDKWDANTIACSRYIFEAAQEFNVALEINTNGFRKGTVKKIDGSRYMYPWLPFWELASEYKINVTVNSDAHHPSEIVERIEDALLIVEKFGFKIIEYPDAFNRQRS